MTFLIKNKPAFSPQVGYLFSTMDNEPIRIILMARKAMSVQAN
jgi:hypothetical protein